ADAREVLQLARCQLESKIEQLLPGIGQALLQVGLGEASQLKCFHSAASPASSSSAAPPGSEAAMSAELVLATKRVSIGSLCAARRSASSATSRVTPATSNNTRPG